MVAKTAKDKVLAAAQELMTGRGYSATTVDSIVARAGVAKGSFYHAFKSKEELALAALEGYAASTWKVLAAGPYRDLDDPVRRALGFVDYLIATSDSLWSRGSLLGSVAVEVAQTHPSLNDRIGALFDRFEEKFVRLFLPALTARDVTEVSAKALAVHLMAVIEGSIITAQSHHSASHLHDGLQHFRRYLALLLREPNA
jgi:TetR/AcrR family transcriptional repressor of nem operon